MKLLYCFSEWHALAKLRMHTSATISLLENLTKDLGKLLRQFRDKTCAGFPTYELPREIAARQRRASHEKTSASAGQRLMKLLNLSTIKLHFMGDYIKHIQQFGTTDPYSTQLVSGLHPSKLPKPSNSVSLICLAG